jgi:hypothetical protein
MVSPRKFRPGDRVKVSRSCPIDFEGVGPVPGSVGRIVSVSESREARRSCTVRFGTHSSEWLIPNAFLEPVGEKGLSRR